MKLIDLTDPFYAPIWIRITVVLVLTFWGVLEIALGNALWAIMCISFAAICAWRFATIDYRNDAD